MANLSTDSSTAQQDVFAVAMRMEEIGKDFYEALALGCDDPRVRTFCLQAARDELRHLDAFRQMQAQWRQSGGAAALAAETAVWLAALAKKQVQPDPQAVRQTAIGGSLPDALALAIQMERDAVRFYEGLVARLPASANALRRIAEEERRHLAGLRLLAR